MFGQACALLCQTAVGPSNETDTAGGNAFRRALFAALASADDRTILASMSVLVALLDRDDEAAANVPLLKLAKMAPLRYAAADAGSDEDHAQLAAMIRTVEDGLRGVGDGVSAAAAAPTRSLSMGLLPPTAEQPPAPELPLAPEPEPEGAAAAASEAASEAVGVVAGGDVASSLPSTTSVQDLVRLLLGIITRHTQGLRVAVLQVAMRLLLTLQTREAAGPLLEEADLLTIQAAVQSASDVVTAHLESQMSNSVFIAVHEEVSKLQQRPLNFEHVVTDPIMLLPLEQERGPYGTWPHDMDYPLTRWP